ncbi:hypothetical protein TgHK011_008775 [Trichoderma gracile]|nr:hypothetical protein TgHK011_008775 [Trichoderma gracile]
MRNTPFATRSSSEVLDGEGLERENGRFESGRDGAGNWWSSSFLWSSTAVTKLAQVPGPPPRPQCVLGRTSRGPRAILESAWPGRTARHSTTLHRAAPHCSIHSGRDRTREPGFFQGSVERWYSMYRTSGVHDGLSISVPGLSAAVSPLQMNPLLPSGPSRPGARRAATLLVEPSSCYYQT